MSRSRFDIFGKSALLGQCTGLVKSRPAAQRQPACGIAGDDVQVLARKTATVPTLGTRLVMELGGNALPGAAFVWSDFEVHARMRGSSDELSLPLATRRYQAQAAAGTIARLALLRPLPGGAHTGAFPTHAASPTAVVHALQGMPPRVDVIITRVVLDRDILGAQSDSVSAQRVRLLLRLLRDGYLAVLGAFWDVGRSGIDDERVLATVDASFNSNQRMPEAAATNQTLRASLSAFVLDCNAPPPPVLVLVEPAHVAHFGLDTLDSMLSAARAHDSLLEHDASASDAARAPLPASRGDALVAAANSFGLASASASHHDTLTSFSTAGVAARHAMHTHQQAVSRRLHAAAIVSHARRISRRALRMLHVCYTHHRYARLSFNIFLHSRLSRNGFVQEYI